jgi:hypothetical protein
MRLGPVLREAWRVWREQKWLAWIPLIASVPAMAGFAVKLPTEASLGWMGRGEDLLLFGVPAALAGAFAETLMIAAVRRARGQRQTPRLFGVVRARWKSALGVQLCGALTGAVSSLAFALPWWLDDLGLDLAAIVLICAVLAVPYAALEITRSAWIEFAMRHVVLEEAEALPALIRAWRFLHGRVRLAIEVYLAAALAYVVSFLLLTTPIAIVRLAGAQLAVLIAVTLASFVIFLATVSIAAVLQSAIWTLSFLDERALD